MGTTRDKSDKTLWEYVLLAVSVFATLVQALSLISQSRTLLAQPSVTTTFVVVVLVGTAISCVFVMLRTKTGTFAPKVPYYAQKQRLAAGIIMAANAIVSILVLATIFGRPYLRGGEPIATGKFGVLVADFTEGANRTPTASSLSERGLPSEHD
jgi:hypothetical protein